MFLLVFLPQIPLRVVPELATYDWGENPMSLGISGNMQYQNASLALQLCKTWMKDHQKSKQIDRFPT